FSTWDAEYYVYLDCLYLEPQTRGQGIGTQIMEEVKAFARAEDCSVIQWQTPDFNEKAIRFYQKIGGVSKAKERFFLEP
ncbi:MAG: GNAT family N-acetyltransferase, partial [Bacteroidota bacterium]